MTTQQDLQNILLTAERNINNFEASPDPTTTLPIAQVKEAVAQNTSEQLATALFPFLQQFINDIAGGVVDQRLSAQLQSIQSDIATIKTKLGL
jgi:hypothetical protein